MTYLEADYPCVGICMNDPDTGYCIGCGRPPWPVNDQGIATAEVHLALPPLSSNSPADPDSPEQR